MKSATRRLSEFLDSFLKYQAQRTSSYIRDTKHFLQKITEINQNRLPENAILVTMDVSSLYTNIDHEEGAEACYEFLELRKNKTISSAKLKSLILLVLRSTAFRFGSSIFKQVMGTSMGTPMAPNYANLFMAKFENEVITSYHQKTGLKPYVWYRYIDDIFIIWTHGADTLDDFITHNQNFSKQKKMKSNISFEVNQSTVKANFLDVSVELKDGVLATTLYSKPTDAHLYLNKSSNHPQHVTKNLPKGQLIRIRRICSELSEYTRNSNIMCNALIKRGYSERYLQSMVKEVSRINREDLLQDKPKEKKDPNLIFVSDWHPVLGNIPSILKRNFHIIENDSVLTKVFPSKPLVAFRRPRTIRNHTVRNDIRKKEEKSGSSKCGKCKLCTVNEFSTSDTITNKKKNISIKLKHFGTCSSQGLIYAARCKKHGCIYVGHTGVPLCSRFSKHRWDIKNRPGNSDLAAHFHKNHRDSDLEVFILQTGLPDEKQREFFEDKWICALQTYKDINTDLHQYAKDMYGLYSKLDRAK